MPGKRFTVVLAAQVNHLDQPAWRSVDSTTKPVQRAERPEREPSPARSASAGTGTSTILVEGLWGLWLLRAGDGSLSGGTFS